MKAFCCRKSSRSMRAISNVSWSLGDRESYSSFDRQLRLLALILHYEDLCRDAIAKNVELPALFAIPARERLGWAKYAAAEEYAANYQQVHDEMDSEIAALIEKAGEDA